MGIYTTEIASDRISSDNPIHQRLLKPYFLTRQFLNGSERLLEVGCGEGRGLPILLDHVAQYDAVDKIAAAVESLQRKYDSADFQVANIPPLSDYEDESYDAVISFQVIEHIKADDYYLKEIYRVLKPGGIALITTPNIKKTLTRNPWHIREYTADQLTDLSKKIFDVVEMKGISGNEKVWAYYESNKASVQRITRFDLFNLQYRLPAFLLRIPYDILNRLNRNKLEQGDTSLVQDIDHEDYLLSEDPDNSLDLFAILRKQE